MENWKLIINQQTTIFDFSIVIQMKDEILYRTLWFMQNQIAEVKQHSEMGTLFKQCVLIANLEFFWIQSYRVHSNGIDWEDLKEDTGICNPLSSLETKRLYNP